MFGCLAHEPGKRNDGEARREKDPKRPGVNGVLQEECDRYENQEQGKGVFGGEDAIQGSLATMMMT